MNFRTTKLWPDRETVTFLVTKLHTYSFSAICGSTLHPFLLRSSSTSSGQFSHSAFIHIHRGRRRGLLLGSPTKQCTTILFDNALLKLVTSQIVELCDGWPKLSLWGFKCVMFCRGWWKTSPLCRSESQRVGQSKKPPPYVRQFIHTSTYASLDTRIGRS